MNLRYGGGRAHIRGAPHQIDGPIKGPRPLQPRSQFDQSFNQLQALRTEHYSTKLDSTSDTRPHRQLPRQSTP